MQHEQHERSDMRATTQKVQCERCNARGATQGIATQEEQQCDRNGNAEGVAT
jgi:hypothetical protein